MTKTTQPTATWSLSGDSAANPQGKPNQDRFYYTPRPLRTAAGRPSALAIICDGVGGQPGGEEASALALERLRAALEPHLRRDGLRAETQQSLLDQALNEANRAVRGGRTPRPLLAGLAQRLVRRPRPARAFLRPAVRGGPANRRRGLCLYPL